MTWYHLLDQYGNHWILNPSVSYYFMSQAVDGSEPIYMNFPAFSLSFIITAAQFTEIVGTLPAENEVQLA